MRTYISVALVSLLASDAIGYAPMPPHDYQPGFELVGHIPGAGKHAGGAASLAGSRIAVAGENVLALDADSGQLVLATEAGTRIASLDIGVGAGLLVFDATSHRAFVADRRRDRVIVVAVHASSLELAATIATPAEPYGVALSPDATTLLVTAIADRTLVAYDVTHATEEWRTPVAAEPRAVAVAPDGKHALVTHLTSDGVELVDLTSHKLATRTLRHDVGPECGKRAGGEKSSLQCADPDATSYARGAFAGVFLGEDVAAVAFQREAPVPRPQFASASHYGGSAIPITRHVAFVGVGSGQAIAQVGVAEPRALAYDAARDALYIAGMGDGHLVVIERATHSDAHWGDTIALADRADPACGVDGLALGADGDVLAWCSFTRSIARVHLEPAADKNAIPRYQTTLARGPELAPTRLSQTAHAGLVRFHTDSPEVARLGRAACASCHVEGRSDGLSWQIEDHTLRTPVLAGRMVGTAPYKWTGRDADLDHSIMSTIDRLGGYHGTHRDDVQLPFIGGPDPIAAYLETLAPVRAPTLAPAVVARGKALFDSGELGCAGCHQGGEFTDHAHHAFTGARFELDTPSLRGASAAPRYLHDGSAATLDDVLAERGSIRGMIARPLSADERADLAAYLRSL